MNRSCEQFFAGARLALNQHRYVVYSQPSGSGNLGFHGLAAMDDRPKLRGFRRQPLSEADNVVCVDVRQAFSRKVKRKRDSPHAVLHGRLYEFRGMGSLGPASNLVKRSIISRSERGGAGSMAWVTMGLSRVRNRNRAAIFRRRGMIPMKRHRDGEVNRRGNGKTLVLDGSRPGTVAHSSPC